MDFFIGKNGQQMGPHSEAEIRTMLREGTVMPKDLFWHEGRVSWEPLHSSSVFFVQDPVITVPAPGSMPPASTGSMPAVSVETTPEVRLLIAGYACIILGWFVAGFVFGVIGIGVAVMLLQRKSQLNGIIILVLASVMTLFGLTML